MLYNRIVIDDRHSDVLLLSFEPINVRAFGAWNMALVADTERTHELLMKYSIGDEFDPSAMAPTSVFSDGRSRYACTVQIVTFLM